VDEHPTPPMTPMLVVWFEELTVAEVAVTLECGEEMVRTHWRRARSHLAARLGEADDAAAAHEEERGRSTTD